MNGIQIFIKSLEKEGESRRVEAMKNYLDLLFVKVKLTEWNPYTESYELKLRNLYKSYDNSEALGAS